MNTLIMAATASLLVAAPAFAQNQHAAHATHWRHRLHAGYHVGAYHAPRAQYDSNDIYVREDRHTAPFIPAPIVPAPDFAWRPQAEQEGVGADLVGPGSSAENPTGQYDVSR